MQFPGGFEYRIHWEKMHLKEAIKNKDKK